MRYSISLPDVSALCDLRQTVGYGRAESDYPAIERLSGITIFHADFAEANAAFYASCGFRIWHGAVLDEGA